MWIYILLIFLFTLIGHIVIIRHIPYIVMRFVLKGTASRPNYKGINALSVADKMPGHQDKGMLRNPDVIFAGCAYDITETPLVFYCTVPDTYWSLSFFASNTDNFFVVNDTHYHPGDTFRVFLCTSGYDDLLLPMEEGDLVVHSPTPFGFALHRVLVLDRANDEQKYIQFLKTQFHVETLNGSPPIQGKVPRSASLLRYAVRSVWTYNLLTSIIATWWFTAAFTTLISLLGGFLFSMLLIYLLFLSSFRLPLTVHNGCWCIPTAAGHKKANMYLRANITINALFALNKEEAIYPLSWTDSNGSELRGDSTYAIHGNGDLPCRWWSVTAYNARGNSLMESDVIKYSVNYQNIVRNNEDGSWKIIISRTRPDDIDEANWLPIGLDVDKVLIALRLYKPKQEFYQNLKSYPLPTIHKLFQFRVE